MQIVYQRQRRWRWQQHHEQHQKEEKHAEYTFVITVEREMNFNSIELKFIFLPPIRWLSLYFYLYLSISLSLSISRFPLLFHSLPHSRCVSVCVFSNFLPVVQIGVLSSSLLSLSYCITSRLFVKIQLIVAKLLHIPFSLHSISFWDNMHIHSIKPGHLKFIEFPCTMLCVSFHNVHVKHSYK